MCRVMEEYVQEREQMLISENIKNALDEGITPEKIVSIFKVSMERVLEIQKERTSK
ncbi:MAG: hypothetical protein J1E62_09345 [Lachnospiraceae bacterium]|nr:hypothetical protein [Lachnospiraceae bacterium]